MAPFLQIYLPCPRQCALGQLLPTAVPSDNSESLHRLPVALMVTIRTGFQVPSFAPKGKEAQSLSSIASQTNQKTAAGFPWAPPRIYAHPLFGTETKRSQLCMHQASSHRLNHFQELSGASEWLVRLLSPRESRSAVEKQDTKYASGIF